jgi:hypothetical protein
MALLFLANVSSRYAPSLSSHSFLTVEQVGTLDDTSILDNLNMNAELFVDHRPKWVGVQEGAAQKATM